ncbi:hypothetical protein QJQ45_026405, partial [Haematococcus lacustris]
HILVLVGTEEHRRRFGFWGVGGGYLPAWSKRECTYVRRMVCGLDVTWLLEQGGVVPTPAMQAEVALQRGLLGLEEGELVNDDWVEDPANRGWLLRHVVHTTREMEAAMAAWQLDMVANRWDALLSDPHRQKLASPKHKFAQIVHTDGVAMSVMFLRPKPAAPPADIRRCAVGLGPPKRRKGTKAEQAAEPTKGKGKAQGKAATAKPAPQPGRWLDRDCNAALNMQRNGESRWRPLELCFWPDQGALPAKGKEYPGLGYKRLRDKPPEAQQQQQPAEAQYGETGILSTLVGFCVLDYTLAIAVGLDARDEMVRILAVDHGASGSGQQEDEGQGQGEQEVIAERRQVIKAAFRALVEVAQPDLSPAQVDAVVAQVNQRMTMSSMRCCLASVMSLTMLLQSFLGQPTPGFPAAGPAPCPPPPPDPACPPYAHPRLPTRRSPRSASPPARLPPPVQLDIEDPNLLPQIKAAMDLLTNASVQEHLMHGPHHRGIRLLPGEVAVFEQPSSAWPVAKLQELDQVHLQGDINSLNANATTIITSITEYYRHPQRFISWQWEWELTKGQLKHDSGLTKAKKDTARWSAAIQPQLQQLAAATPAGTTLDGLQAHILALKATWDPLWEEYLKPRWRRQRLALHHAQERIIEGFCKKVVNGMKWVSRQHYHQERGVAVFLGAGNFSQSGWKAGAVRAGFRKVVEQPSRPSTDPRPDRLVIVDEFRTSRVNSSVHARQPCPAPSRSPGPAPCPAPTWPSATTPGPPMGQVADRDTNPCLNFQRIGESKQRPLELCSWKDLDALAPIGKEYHQRYKLVNDRLPKVRQRLHRAAEYRRGIDGRARNNAVVLVDEHRTTRVSSAVNGKQLCEEELDYDQPTRRPAPTGPRSSQEATPAAASEPGPSTPLPAKRNKRIKAEPAAEPTKGKGKAQGKAATAKPAPQPGRWLDRDCNATLNMQRIGESRWRPLELCFWPDQGALPAKGKEYPGLGYKRLRDKPPEAQQQQQPAEAQ